MSLCPNTCATNADTRPRLGRRSFSQETRYLPELYLLRPNIPEAMRRDYKRRDEKREFLQLLLRDLPKGYAIYCHQHIILHICQPKPSKVEGAKLWKETCACKARYRLPLGATGGPPVGAVQLVARGAAGLEQLAHYESLEKFTVAHHICCIADHPRDFSTEPTMPIYKDVTCYGRKVGNNVVLAMQYRAHISKKRLAFHKGCADETKNHAYLLLRWSRFGGNGFDLYLAVQDLIDLVALGHAAKDIPMGYMVTRRLGGLAGIPYTRVRIATTRGGAVNVQLDMFADLRQGLARPRVPHLPLGIIVLDDNIVTRRRHRATGTAGPYIDTQALLQQRWLRETVQEHFQDHEEKLEEVRKSKLRWKISSIRFEGVRAGLFRKN